MNYEWTLPIKTISEANCQEHWSLKSKRHKSQKLAIRIHFLNEKPKINLPCKITLTRCSLRFLDGDNLQSAFKWIRDEISDYIIPGKTAGMADNDPRITWQYDQEKSKDLGIKIIISS